MNDLIVEKIGVFLDKGSVSISTIEKFENKFSICFPSSYRNLLAQFNQLYPDRNCFDFNVKNKENERDIVFLGYGEASTENIEKSQDHDVYGHDRVITIGRSANGDYICFDYRQNSTTDNPAVVLMYHDQYTKDESGQPKMTIAKIADNFEAFIDMLHE